MSDLNRGRGNHVCPEVPDGFLMPSPTTKQTRNEILKLGWSFALFFFCVKSFHLTMSTTHKSSCGSSLSARCRGLHSGISFILKVASNSWSITAILDRLNCAALFFRLGICRLISFRLPPCHPSLHIYSILLSYVTELEQLQISQGERKVTLT